MLSNKLGIYEQSIVVLLAGVMVFLPLSINLSSYFIVASFVLWGWGLLSGHWRLEKAAAKALPIHFIPVILAVAGLIHTTNTEYAYSFLTRLVSFVALPVVMATLQFGKKQAAVFLYALIAGTVGAYFYVLYSFLFLDPGCGFESLFEKNFIFLFNVSVAKKLMHPTYLAMYFLLGVLGLANSALQAQSMRTKYILLGASALLLLFMISLAAKMPVLEMGVILMVVPIAYLVNNRKSKKLAGYLVGLTVLFMLVSIFLIKFPNRAVQEANDYYNYLTDKPLKELYSYDELGVEYDKFWFEKTNRIVIWKNSLEVAKGSLWIGYGTGDVQDELIETYKKNKELWRMQFFNSHNQYIDYQLRYGLAGVLFLLVYLGVFFTSAWKKGDYLYLGFLIMVSLGFLTENIIQRHWGIVFFAFFNSLYYYRKEV